MILTKVIVMEMSRVTAQSELTLAVDAASVFLLISFFIELHFRVPCNCSEGK